MRNSLSPPRFVPRIRHLAKFVAALLFAAGLLLSQIPWKSAGAQPARPDWLPGALEELRRAEYSFATETGGVCTAPNRAHDLRARLSRDGIDLTSRTQGDGAWSLRLSVTAIGREGAAEATRPVWPQARANRVEYARGRTT
ncbi:MAG TPA: hypothetical protein VJW75_08150, partial [Candidatus Eisenbacteria bacterium]|nr:hypothetical protein [Candidatus Eisenbacteria bacterium]